MQEKVLPEIIASKGKGEGPLRMWSAGCSTGEETYSLAIAVREILRKGNTKDLPTFIYGTDIMEDKLEEAKDGVYNEEKLKGINSNIKFRYFEQLTPKRYTLDVATKRITRFRKYDLAMPEALAGFDMIACRNVLIYFQKKLQDNVIKRFYKALRPGGILWLGKSESLSDKTRPLFDTVYNRERIFRKI